jgi:hypothetical protein
VSKNTIPKKSAFGANNLIESDWLGDGTEFVAVLVAVLVDEVVDRFVFGLFFQLHQ